MKFVDIMFGDWLPDLRGVPNPAQPGYLTRAVGIRPLLTGGWCGMPAPTDLASVAAAGASGTVLYAFAFPKPSSSLLGEDANFIAITTEPKAYQSANNGVAWSEVTKAAGFDAVSGGPVFWDHCLFNDFIIITGGNTLYEKSINDATATDFADLAGSPPDATTVARVRQHVVVGNLVGVTNGHAAVQWCAIGNPEDWPTPGTTDALAKESGRQFLPLEFGTVVKVAGNEKIGVIWQRNGITRMTYVGGNVGYEFDTFETRFGGIDSAPGSFVQVASGQWMWPTRVGLFWTDGYTARRVSDGTIGDAIFGDELDHADRGATDHSGMPFRSGAYDQRRDLYIFASAGAGYAYAFQISTGRCFRLDDNNDMIDAVVFSGIEEFTNDIQRSIVYNFAPDRKLQALTLDPPNVWLATGWIEAVPGKKIQIQGAHLIGSNVPGTLAIKAKAADSYADINVEENFDSGTTTLTAQTLGMKRSARMSGQFFLFTVTGASSQNQVLKGLRLYYTEAEPAP